MSLAHVTDKVELVRQLAWDGNFPVDPVTIGEGLLITRTVNNSSLDCVIQFEAKTRNELEGASGFAELTLGGERPVFRCVFNSSEALVRQRFTQAHELGHVVLDHVNEHNRMMRDEQFTAGGEVYEIEANHFAAELLMPSKYMEILVREIPDIQELADKFGVSTTALQFRLKNLGFL